MIYWFDLLGVAVFAVSGALAAMQHQLVGTTRPAISDRLDAVGYDNWRRIFRYGENIALGYATAETAVAAWVSRVDAGATRATKDVDLLVRRQDAPQVTAVITALGFAREDLRDLVLFIDPDEPSKKSGVHLVWAGERIRPSHPLPSPSVDESERDPDGFLIASLPALVRMKLNAFRAIDQVHIADVERLIIR